jgi:hypothetical protein
MAKTFATFFTQAVIKSAGIKSCAALLVMVFTLQVAMLGLLSFELDRPLELSEQAGDTAPPAFVSTWSAQASEHPQAAAAKRHPSTLTKKLAVPTGAPAEPTATVVERSGDGVGERVGDDENNSTGLSASGAQQKLIAHTNMSAVHEKLDSTIEHAKNTPSEKQLEAVTPTRMDLRPAPGLNANGASASFASQVVAHQLQSRDDSGLSGHVGPRPRKRPIRRIVERAAPRVSSTAEGFEWLDVKSAGKGGYTLQLVSVADRARLYVLQRKLAQVAPTMPMRMQVDGKTRFALFSRAYAERSEASVAARKFSRWTGTRPWIRAAKTLREGLRAGSFEALRLKG